MRRGKFVLIVNGATGCLFSLKLVAVEVGDTFFGLRGRDPMEVYRRKTQDSDNDGNCFVVKRFFMADSFPKS